jgi:hypothetical protein
MPEERIICPIRFIRKPEESECIKEQCGFWVDGELYDSESKGPVRFTAVMNMPKNQEEPETTRRRLGKCAVLAIAEEMVKARQH